MTEVFSYLSELQFTKGWWVMLLPSILIIVDLFTGIGNAWIKGELKSYRLREGMGKKYGEFVLLLLGYLFYEAFGLSKAFPCAVSIYITFMEGVSILENLKKLGVPIPKFVDKALADTNEKIQNVEFTSKKDAGDSEKK